MVFLHWSCRTKIKARTVRSTPGRLHQLSSPLASFILFNVTHAHCVLHHLPYKSAMPPSNLKTLNNAVGLSLILLSALAIWGTWVTASTSHSLCSFSAGTLSREQPRGSNALIPCAGFLADDIYNQGAKKFYATPAHGIISPYLVDRSNANLKVLKSEMAFSIWSKSPWMPRPNSFPSSRRRSDKTTTTSHQWIGYSED